MNQTQQPSWLVNTYYSAMKEKHIGNDSKRSSTSYNTKEIIVITRKHRKESRLSSSICGYYQKRSTTWRSFHPHSWNDSNERNKKREEMRWVIYTDLLSSILAIENNRVNHPILNQIYYILAELHSQRKRITLCKVPTTNMWKPETNNKTLPTRFPPMDGQHKETWYPRWLKETTRKRLWSGENYRGP